MSDILLIGIGNISRADDGLGWMFADEMAHIFGHIIDVKQQFQLAVEDSLTIASYQKVIFVDASHNHADGGFIFRQPVMPEGTDVPFTSHTQSPENIIFLCSALFGKIPEAYVMEICGKNWTLGEIISEEAKSNLQKAITHFKSWMADYILREKSFLTFA